MKITICALAVVVAIQDPLALQQSAFADLRGLGVKTLDPETQVLL